tara:strand:+ start:500 stop:781 length:282 start_codon:yes stop_codon:yes gene_type:complete
LTTFLKCLPKLLSFQTLKLLVALHQCAPVVKIIVFKVAETYQDYKIVKGFRDGFGDGIKGKRIVFFNRVQMDEEAWNCKLEEAPRFLGRRRCG